MGVVKMPFSDFMPWIWITITVVSAIILFVTLDIDAVWFVIGALLTLSVKLAIPSLHIVWQLVIFVASTVVLLFTTGRLVKRRLRRKNINANVNALVGQEVTIVEDCNEFDKGSATLNDVVWTTICQSGYKLEKGEKAVIVAIQNNKLVIKPKEEKSAE